MLTKITNYVLLAWSRLTNFFGGNLDFRGLLRILAGQAQEIEDAIFLTYEINRDIDNATGFTLDSIGALVGAPPRGTLSDAQYRARVKLQVSINRYGGQQNQLYALAKAVVPAWNVTAQPRYDDEFNGVYTVKSNPPNSLIVSNAQARELARILANNGPAGYRVIVYAQPQPVSASFSFAGGGGLGFGAGAFVSTWSF